MKKANFLKTPDSKPLSDRVPVTVVSGFLGAGKTTLLNRILRKPNGRKIAVIVNDVGEVNIDASLIQSETEADAGAGMRKVVELTNGCVCCSIQEELAEAVGSMAASGSFDHIVIEATGVAEPLSIIRGLNRRNMWGVSLGNQIVINAMVTVIDASLFEKEWENIRRSDKRRRLLLLGDQRRPIFELLLEQIECADFVLLNKMDRTEQPVDRLETFVRELNPRAEMRTCKHAEVDPELLLTSNRYDREKTLDAPRWKQELQRFSQILPGATKSAPLSPDREYGIKTFVYRARRPFDGKRFSRFVHHEVRGLLRAKGFYWVEERNDEVGVISIAGDLVRSDFAAKWWAVRLDEKSATREEVPPNILETWAPDVGDRRQEIVFIGIDMDESEIRQKLDQCLSS